MISYLKQKTQCCYHFKKSKDKPKHPERPRLSRPSSQDHFSNMNLTKSIVNDFKRRLSTKSM